MKNGMDIYAELDYIFEQRDIDSLVSFFKSGNIPTQPKDENLLVYEYIQSIHNFSNGTYLLPQSKDVYICFLFIYKKEVDKTLYGYKDARDILEEKNKLVFEVFLKETELTKHRIEQMVLYANHLKMDMYMSISTFVRPERKERYVYNANTIIIDLDIYKTSYECDIQKKDFDEYIYNEMKPLFEEIGYEPSMFLDSGRGRYLVFRLDNNINFSKEAARYLYKKVVALLIEKFKAFGADSACSDLSRVFHLIGSINTKTKGVYKKGAISSKYFWDSITNEDGYMYKRVSIAIGGFPLLTNVSNISTLATNLGMKKSTKKQYVFYPKSRFSYNKYNKVNQQRDEDFNKLLCLRNYDIKGYRNIFFHLMSVNCFYCGLDESEVLSYLSNINSKLKEPYEKGQLLSVIRYAKENKNLFERDAVKAIKYRNSTMVRLLDITHQEQRHMKQLIGNGIAKDRQDERSKRYNKDKYTPIKKANEEKKLQLKKDMYEYKLHTLKTNDEIAQKFGLDKRTVDNILGGEYKFCLVGKMNTKKLVMYYTNIGYSISQISEMLEIDKSLVSRYRKISREE